MPDIRALSPARLATASILALVLLAAASGARAQTWTETGDAGDLPATAQTTLGTGPLNTLFGGLSDSTDVDMYCLHLTAVPPAGLPIAQLQCVIIQGPNVYLFDAAGNGVFMNETCAAGAKTLLAPSASLPAGTYYLAVSYYRLVPVSANGPIWLTGLPGQRAPDGPGAGGPITGWVGSPVVGPINPYQVNLAFMGYCGAPTPTTGRTWGSLKTIYR